jgi:hypothetical protein
MMRGDFIKRQKKMICEDLGSDSVTVSYTVITVYYHSY